MARLLLLVSLLVAVLLLPAQPRLLVPQTAWLLVLLVLRVLQVSSPVFWSKRCCVCKKYGLCTR
jgi:hypothetical protein